MIFSKNFKLFKTSRNLKENIFFNKKLVYKIIHFKKKKYNLFYKPTTIKLNIIKTSTYFKINYFNTKKNNIKFFFKKNKKKLSLIYILYKSSWFTSPRHIIIFFKKKHIIVNNRRSFSPFIQIKPGDIIQFKNIEKKEIIKTIFWSQHKETTKVIRKIPKQLEISLFSNTIIVCF